MTLPQPDPDPDYRDDRVVPLRPVPDPADDEHQAEAGDDAADDTAPASANDTANNETTGTALVPTATATKAVDQVKVMAGKPRSAWRTQPASLENKWAWVNSDRYRNSSVPAVNAARRVWGVFAVIKGAVFFVLDWLLDEPKRAVPATALGGVIYLVWWLT